MSSTAKLLAALSLTFSLATPALALEYPIGTPQNKAGMEIGAVYLQPVEMEPDGMMRKATESDIHIEADIHALAGNPNGFEEGADSLSGGQVRGQQDRLRLQGGRRVHARWSPTTARTMATTSPRRPRQVQGEVYHPAAVREQARALRPPHRPRHRRPSVVQPPSTSARSSPTSASARRATDATGVSSAAALTSASLSGAAMAAPSDAALLEKPMARIWKRSRHGMPKEKEGRHSGRKRSRRTGARQRPHLRERAGTDHTPEGNRKGRPQHEKRRREKSMRLMESRQARRSPPLSRSRSGCLTERKTETARSAIGPMPRWNCHCIRSAPSTKTIRPFSNGSGTSLEHTVFRISVILPSAPNATAFRASGASDSDSVAILGEAWYQASIPAARAASRTRSRESWS